MQNNTIDIGIRPICDILNQHPEIKTRWSCEGHYSHSRPYVSFSAPHDIARNIHDALQHAQQQGTLRYNWALNGSFQDIDRQLQWLLALDTALPRWMYIRQFRTRIDHEIQHVSEILKKVVLNSTPRYKHEHHSATAE